MPDDEPQPCPCGAEDTPEHRAECPVLNEAP